jgi:hypothetical protein
MSCFDRRLFLGTSLGGAAAALSLAPSVLMQAFAEGREGEAPKPESRPVVGYAPSSLFLTWRTDPTTTMTIQWVDRESTDDRSIRFAPLDAEVWQSAPTLLRPFPDTESKVHRCELIGLHPGTEYQFQIGPTSPIYRFRTMPARATDTIQFVSGGDSGIDVHAIKTCMNAARQEPWFALIGGDLAYDNGRSPETFLKFLVNYSRYMVDPLGRMIPMITCIGNHEVNGGYAKGREFSPHYLSVFDGLFSETTYGVLDVGDYLSLVLLDTGHVSPIGGAQTDWLESTLAARQERPHLIVANHVPAYPSVRHPGSPGDAKGTGAENRQHWVPLFERYNVDVVLEHHDHAFKRTHPLAGGLFDKNGVVYLGDGSWGKLRMPNAPEVRPYLAAVSKAYHVTVHRLEGNQRFHVALDDTGKVADVCATYGKRPARRG